MISNASLHAFSMPTIASASGTATAAVRNSAGASTRDGATTLKADQPVPGSGARGALLDRWA